MLKNNYELFWLIKNVLFILQARAWLALRWSATKKEVSVTTEECAFEQ